MDDFFSVFRILIVFWIVLFFVCIIVFLLKSNIKLNYIKFYFFGGIKICVDRFFKWLSESFYFLCLKYCMVNFIMECLLELYFDLLDLVDLILLVFGCIFLVIGLLGFIFSKFFMEVVFIMVVGWVDVIVWGFWSLKIVNLNFIYFILNFSFIFLGKFSIVIWI